MILSLLLTQVTLEKNIIKKLNGKNHIEEVTMNMTCHRTRSSLSVALGKQEIPKYKMYVSS